MEQRYDYYDKYMQDIISLPDKEAKKVITVSDAIARRFEAEAMKESHQKWRILFQRTAEDMLPFIIYCLSFAPIAAYSLFRIVDLEPPIFYWALVGLLAIMIMPIFFLPRLPFKKLFSKNKI